MYKRSKIRTFRRNRVWQWVAALRMHVKDNRNKNGNNKFRRYKYSRNEPLRFFVYVALGWACALVLLCVLIPGLIVKQEGVALQKWRSGVGASDLGSSSGWQSSGMDGGLHRDGGPQGAIQFPESPVDVPVYLTERKRIEWVPLEAYVLGVLAAEMPIQFETEALKAQAIAARTYIVNRIVKEDFSHVPVEGAWVTDSQNHQAYLSYEQIEQRLQDADFANQFHKLTQAVAETAGLVLTYQNEPIQAAYFSTSNGRTENSEEYWSEAIPYLRSVPSPWDQPLSPKYEQVITLPINEAFAQLGIDRRSLSGTDTGTVAAFSVRTLAWTEGGRIKTIEIAGRTFSGREIREKLDLPSAHFHMKIVGNHLEITTYGYGHGVGMSQYGAQGMALEGWSAEDILKYYYQGIEITDMDRILQRYDRVFARKY